MRSAEPVLFKKLILVSILALSFTFLALTLFWIADLRKTIAHVLWEIDSVQTYSAQFSEDSISKTCKKDFVRVIDCMITRAQSLELARFDAIGHALLWNTLGNALTRQEHKTQKMHATLDRLEVDLFILRSVIDREKTRLPASEQLRISNYFDRLLQIGILRRGFAQAMGNFELNRRELERFIAKSPVHTQNRYLQIKSDLWVIRPKMFWITEPHWADAWIEKMIPLFITTSKNSKQSKT